MKKKLSEITEIKTGIFAKPELQGEIVYLHAKHFDESGNLISTFHRDLKNNKSVSRHLLERGDVLFAAKGYKNFAAVFNRDDVLAVASTTFFVIKPQCEIVLPEYIAWFLNSSSTQKFLKRNAVGTSMVSIPKTILDEVKIPIPEIEKQRSISESSRLANKELEIRLRLADLQNQQIQLGIMRTIR